MKIAILFLICSATYAADRDIICASSTCTPDFTPINQYEKIYYTSIDAGTNFVDNILVDTVLGQNPRSLRYYFESNSKAFAPNINIKLQSKSSEFNAGDTMVLLDYVNNLNTNLNGYSGTIGKSASEICGEKMLLGGSLGYGDLAKAEFQAKRIENSSLPINKCIAADVDFLQKNTFSCDEGYAELDKLSPQVTVRRYRGKSKCLGVGFKDVCVQKTVEVTCTWGLKYTSPANVAGQFSTNPSETIQKKFILPEEEWNLKATSDERKSYLCQNLTKGSPSELDSTNLIANGEFTLDAAGWTLGNNTKVVNSKIKLGTGPELVIEDQRFLSTSGQRGYSFHLGYLNTNTAGIKNYTYQVVNKLSNVSCSGQYCTILTPFSSMNYSVDSDRDPYIVVAKVKVSNPKGEYSFYDIKYKLVPTSAGSAVYSSPVQNTWYYDDNNYTYSTGNFNDRMITRYYDDMTGRWIHTTNMVCPNRLTSASQIYESYPTLGIYSVNPGDATYVCVEQYSNQVQCSCSGSSFSYYNLSPSLTYSMSVDSSAFAKQIIPTEANEYYRLTATGYTAIEDSFITSGDARVYDFSENVPIDYALGQDGALVVEPGQTVTIPNGAVKQYSSVNVKAGGVLQIADGMEITVLIVRGEVIVNGTIIGMNGKGYGNVSKSYTAPDFSVYTSWIPQANGGNGGKGGESGGPIYNYGGSQNYGNGGSGGHWQRWYPGIAASFNCGGPGGVDSGASPGCIYGGNGGSAGSGAGAARAAHGQSLVIIGQSVTGSGTINLNGGQGGRGGNGTWGAGGGGGAGGSAGSLRIKAKLATVNFTLRGGAGGAGGSSQSSAPGGGGGNGASGNYEFYEMKYLARQSFDEMNLVDSSRRNDTVSFYPLITTTNTRKKYYIDFVFKAQSNRSVVELASKYLNTPVYFDTVTVKKVSPYAGPPTRPPISVANQGGNVQGIGGNIGYYTLKSDPGIVPTNIGYDPETFDLIDGSTWKVQFAEIGGECPVFTVKTKSNYLTSIISYDQNDELCDDIKIDQDPNNTINWKNIGFDRKQEFGTEQLNCSITSCPVNNVVQSFSKNLDTINTSMGLSGTQQGEGIFFIYDILGSTSVTNIIGSTGVAGANDLPEYKDDKICAKIQDITTESASSEFASSPLVNFKKFNWTALKVENTNAVPKVPDNNKKQIYIYKKIDSSVRYLLKQELF